MKLLQLTLLLLITSLYCANAQKNNCDDPKLEISDGVKMLYSININKCDQIMFGLVYKGNCMTYEDPSSVKLTWKKMNGQSETKEVDGNSVSIKEWIKSVTPGDKLVFDFKLSQKTLTFSYNLE